MKPLLNLLLVALLLTTSACSVYDASLVGNGLRQFPSGRRRAPAPTPTMSMPSSRSATCLWTNPAIAGAARLDLDGMDTASIGDAAECVAANGNPPLDGIKGIDNAFGQFVLPTLVSLISCLEDNIALHQGLGRGTVLLRLRDWNGKPNDAKVDVSVLSAVDGTSLGDVAAVEWGGPDGSNLMLPGATEEAPGPDWDGEDYFFVDPSSLIAGDIDRPEVWKTTRTSAAAASCFPWIRLPPSSF